MKAGIFMIVLCIEQEHLIPVKHTAQGVEILFEIVELGLGTEGAASGSLVTSDKTDGEDGHGNDRETFHFYSF